jgi:peptidoglycan/LPS O-acetylase OafA/YrhL
MRRGPDTNVPPPLVVAAALTAVEAFVLAALGVLEVADLHSARLTMGVTTAAFFLGAGAALAWCAWSLWRGRRWARGPVVMAQLIVLGLAWNLWDGSTKPLSAGLAVVALVVIAGLVHPASTRVLEGDPGQAG